MEESLRTGVLKEWMVMDWVAWWVDGGVTAYRCVERVDGYGLGGLVGRWRSVGKLVCRSKHVRLLGPSELRRDG